MNEIVLKGVPAASGISYGPAFILDKVEFILPKRVIVSSEVNSEIARFEEALTKARQEIHLLKDKINNEMGLNKAQIFDAHLLILEDPTLIEKVCKGIKEHKHSAEYVFSKVIKKYIQVFCLHFRI